MPRKKKQQEEQVVEQKKQETSSIGYKGVVNIKVVRNGNVVKRITHKNTGTSQMFYFLACCLAGNYEERNRPKYINLFQVGSQEGDTPELKTQLSTICSKSFVVEDVVDGKKEYGTSLEFVIPGVYVEENSDINLLRLYTVSESSDVDSTTKYAAEVLLSDDDKIEIGTNTVNTSILITWTLYLTNNVPSSVS